MPRIPYAVLAVVLALTLAAPQAARAKVKRPADGVQPTLVADADADADDDARGTRRVATGERAPLPVYKPPRRGAPRAKVGGGARTAARDWPAPLALAPPHVAHTTAAQPSLFWHLDRLPDPNATLVLTVSDDVSVEPLAELELPRPTSPGIQRVRLADHAVRLAPEIEYEWSIALVRDRSARSLDIISNGFIRRVAEPPELSLRTVQTLAELGLWYDALESASDLIDANPTDSRMREARGALLRQVGLQEAVQR